MLPIAAGLTAGLVHVVSGPDHLAAVAPLAADVRRQHWRAGLLWGLGHTGGVFAVAALALVLRDMLPLDHVSSWSERIVGAALVLIGLWAVRKGARLHLHAHRHTHDGVEHAHLHLHGERPAGQRSGHARHAHGHTHASFLMGVLHGLAGSSHLFGVLPSLAFASQADSIGYLAGYGAGTVAAMTIFASTIGLLAAGAERRGVGVYRGLMYACGTAAILIGGFWLTA